MTLDHRFLSKQSTLNKFVPSPADQNVAPVEITVLKFKCVFGYRQSECRLTQYAPGLRQSFKFKALQVPASIWELEYDKKLVTREDIWERNTSSQLNLPAILRQQHNGEFSVVSDLT